MGFLGPWIWGSEGHLGPSRGLVWRVDSGSILGHSGPYSRPLSRKPHLKHENCLHLAVGRVLISEYTNIGVLGLVLVGTGIAPLQAHPIPTTPGTPLPPLSWLAGEWLLRGTE